LLGLRIQNRIEGLFTMMADVCAVRVPFELILCPVYAAYLVLLITTSTCVYVCVHCYVYRLNSPVIILYALNDDAFRVVL